MRLVARNLAMGIYELPKILEMCGVKVSQFHTWKNHPRFTSYLKNETEAWNAAQNTAERTKLKAGIVMEEWIAETYMELKDRKIALNHRVELGKLVAKIAGMGENSGGFSAGLGGTGGGFSLQINIAPGHSTVINARPIVEDADFAPVDEPPQRRVMRATPAIVEAVPIEEFEDDGYDPFTSPDTLGDL